MVNVGDKPESLRTAVASGRVTVNESTFALIKNGCMKKGDVLAVAHVLKPPEGLQGRCRLHKNAVRSIQEECLRDKDKRRAVYHRAEKGRSFRRDL